jgi:flagellar hook-length control protein FliK
VQLSVDRAGDLSATIIASPEAMSHMQQAMDSLHHSLTEQGLSLAQFDLRQQDSGNDPHKSSESDARHHDIALLEAETDTPPTQSAHIAGGDYLDLQI